MPTPPVTPFNESRGAPARGVPRGALTAVLLAGGSATAVAAVLADWIGDEALVARTASLAVVGGIALLWLVSRQLGGARFGVANAVTVVRAAVVVLLGALLVPEATPALGWSLVGLGLAGVALDGVDGALARGRNEASAFGARFDMETDALLILVLAALVWQHGKAGIWVLAAGLLRYLFVVGGVVLPWLRAPLPKSRRRQAVCVVQIVTLLGALVPLVLVPWSAALALAGLAMLGWSFGIDVAWLARHARPLQRP